MPNGDSVVFEHLEGAESLVQPVHRAALLFRHNGGCRPALRSSCHRRDLLTYAIGIGCTELNFVYENDGDFAAFPTYPIVLAFKGTDEDVVSFPSPAMMTLMETFIPLEGTKVQLDGERMIEQLAPIDPNGGEYTLRTRNIGVHKRGSGASVENEAQLIDSAGKVVYRIVSGAFFVGAKNFKDSGITNSEAVPVPSRAPDAVVRRPRRTPP